MFARKFFSRGEKVEKEDFEKMKSKVENIQKHIEKVFKVDFVQSVNEIFQNQDKSLSLRQHIEAVLRFDGYDDKTILFMINILFGHLIINREQKKS